MEWASDWADDLRSKTLGRTTGSYSILTSQGTPPPGLNRYEKSIYLVDFKYHEDEIRHCLL